VVLSRGSMSETCPSGWHISGLLWVCSSLCLCGWNSLSRNTRWHSMRKFFTQIVCKRCAPRLGWVSTQRHKNPLKHVGLANLLVQWSSLCEVSGKCGHNALPIAPGTVIFCGWVYQFACCFPLSVLFSLGHHSISSCAGLLIFTCCYVVLVCNSMGNLFGFSSQGPCSYCWMYNRTC
jgi:hypothetical protein